MEQGDNRIPREQDNPEELGLSPGEREDFSPARNGLSRFVLKKLFSVGRGGKSLSALRGRRELTNYTVGDFTSEQLHGAHADFFTWYEIAQNPDAATDHARVIELFGDTLDPEDASVVFSWWKETVAGMAADLGVLQRMLDAGLKLNDPRAERVLSITKHTENCVNHLLEHLDQSRIQDA